MASGGRRRRWRSSRAGSRPPVAVEWQVPRPEDGQSGNPGLSSVRRSPRPRQYGSTKRRPFDAPLSPCRTQNPSITPRSDGGRRGAPRRQPLLIALGERDRCTLHPNRGRRPRGTCGGRRSHRISSCSQVLSAVPPGADAGRPVVVARILTPANRKDQPWTYLTKFSRWCVSVVDRTTVRRPSPRRDAGCRPRRSRTSPA